jgi:hypothetical protein
MRRQIALIITLLHLVGMLGVPVVAYSCVESGKDGVVSYLSWSPGTCYVDSCCDGEQDSPNVQMRTEDPCCDGDIKITPQNGVTLPDAKYGQSELLQSTHEGFDPARPDVSATPTSLLLSIFHAPINPPLLI